MNSRSYRLCSAARRGESDNLLLNLFICSLCLVPPSGSQAVDLGSSKRPLTPSQTISTQVDSLLGIQTFPLWPQGAPGAQGIGEDDIPTLTVFAPRSGSANGTGVVIAPGGAYIGLASDLEGRTPADWFAAHGVTAFVLRYRLGAKYPFPIPLEDARRAIRFVRANATSYGLDPNRIGMLGFSAGGHLAATAAALPEAGALNSSDPIKQQSSSLNFLILAYPWLNAMQPFAYPGKISYCSMIPSFSSEQCRSFENNYSPSRLVLSKMPPTFIFSLFDDGVVPVEVSLRLYQELLGAGIPSQLHIFSAGGHGVGLGKGDPSLDLWPQLLEAWLRERDLLPTRLH